MLNSSDPQKRILSGSNFVFFVEKATLNESSTERLIRRLGRLLLDNIDHIEYRNKIAKKIVIEM